MTTPDDTCDTLIAEIKLRAMIPTSQKTYQEVDILRRATQEMDSYIMPLIKKVREEYFVWEEPITIVSGQTDYAIHERAMGGVIRDLLFDNGSGVRSIPYLDPDQRELQNFGGFRDVMFYLRWDKIVLLGSPSSGTVTQVFYIRPGRLVPNAEAGQISAINTLTNTVTISGLTIPATFVATASTDMISGSQMHSYKALDQAIVSVLGQDITYASLPAVLAVGDWISLAGESPLVQLPRELFPLLCQKVAVSILWSLGDPKWKDLNEELKSLYENALNLIEPRVQGEEKIIVTGMNRRWWFS